MRLVQLQIDIKKELLWLNKFYVSKYLLLNGFKSNPQKTILLKEYVMKMFLLKKEALV